MNRLALPALLLTMLCSVVACGDDSTPSTEDENNSAANNSVSNNNPANNNPANNNPANNNPTNNHTHNNNNAHPHWGYDGEVGPEAWADLSPDYAACAEGMAQSPVDIPQVYSEYLDLEVSYAPAPLRLTNNGHTVQIDLPTSNTMTLEGHTYALQQLHYHAASEHILHGNELPMELHLVHKDEAGQLAVLAVLVEEEAGVSNQGLAAIIPHLPATAETTVDASEFTLDLLSLLPGERPSGYRYRGSLTTPPCTEGVEWTVLDTPLLASPEQIAAFTAIFQGNRRPPQSLHDRTIESPHWTYEGAEGPEGWADLSPGYAACADGFAQTPVDIDSVSPVALSADLAAWREEEPLHIHNNGHTVQINIPPGNFSVLDGATYQLKQLHYHAHSEHTVGGEPFPVELHFVHADDLGNLAVVALFLHENEELRNEFLDAIIPHLPPTPEPEVTPPGATFSLQDLLDPELDNEGWRYDGSLTTPPCSEGVAWFVLATPALATPDQIEALTQLYEANYRPLQDLNGRAINP